MDFESVLNKFTRKNILVVGDIIVDHYILGKVDRISPEAPVPVVEVKQESYMLGGAGNVANNIVSLGASVSLAGITGKDHRADILFNLLKNKNIGSEGIIQDDRQTTVKTRVIAHNQQVVRVDRENRSLLNKEAFNAITDYIGRNIYKFDAVIISDYKKGVISRELIEFILDKAKERNVFVAVDPKVGHFHYYKGVSLITPNKKEAGEGSKIEINDLESLEKAGAKLLRELQCGAALITRGDEGMSLFHGADIWHIPTEAKEVYDVTGAGDTVIAVFTLSCICGASLFDCAVIANHGAGIVVGELGTSTVSLEQIRDSLKNTCV
ncbi:cytochrome C biogenesis protein CcdA [Candidatus Magnetoovum chiemensis]|nr:cytochrome C biogenesis protein CcdA [Candidatus Magnetoovum chiemensis]